MIDRWEKVCHERSLSANANLKREKLHESRAKGSEDLADAIGIKKSGVITSHANYLAKGLERSRVKGSGRLERKRC